MLSGKVMLPSELDSGCLCREPKDAKTIRVIFKFLNARFDLGVKTRDLELERYNQTSFSRQNPRLLFFAESINIIRYGEIYVCGFQHVDPKKNKHLVASETRVPSPDGFVPWSVWPLGTALRHPSAGPNLCSNRKNIHLDSISSIISIYKWIFIKSWMYRLWIDINKTTSNQISRIIHLISIIKSIVSAYQTTSYQSVDFIGFPSSYIQLHQETHTLTIWEPNKWRDVVARPEPPMLLQSKLDIQLDYIKKILTLQRHH
jgi:hypothetical protein